MSIMKRILSTLLAVLMLAGSFALVVGAEDGTTKPAYTTNTTSARPTYWYFSGKDVQQDDTGAYIENKTSKNKIATPKDKLALMDLRYEKGDYRLYVDAYSGEVATECISTGEILFSNPYDISLSSAKDTVKTNLMSQLIVEFTDITTDQSTIYDSYTWCASRGQMVVKSIKNGIRVEYSIGREEAKMLVPQLIKRESFEAIIKGIEAAYIEADKEADWEFDYKKIFGGFYALFDPNEVTEAERQNMYKTQPITKKGIAVYALDTTATPKEKAKIEQAIKTYYPSYTFEQLDEDHMEVEFVAKDENAPLFKMALEYTLDEYGMSVRLPANGIRFNESLYRLENVTILPYMGAGSSPNAGYTFFPDGSGALFDFEELDELGMLTNIAGKIYGNNDYAYHTITGNHQEVIRYPVFGIVENEVFNMDGTIDAPTEDTEDSTTGGTGDSTTGGTGDSTTGGTGDSTTGGTGDSTTGGTGDSTTGGTGDSTTGGTGDSTTGGTTSGDATVEKETYSKYRGFVAIIEEGDALMELATYHPTNTCEYHTVTMKVYPRPKDEYNVADSISVGSNSNWTVVSARKYTGSYKIRYVMLTDDKVAEETAAKLTAAGKTVPTYYDCSYVGMAAAYRDYLERKGTLTALTAEDVSENIPLYIETLGAMETTERFLSIPLSVMTPLTTFEDITVMYDKLSSQGINNINFIMSGFTDGGMTYPSVPYNLKWEGAVSKEIEFEDLVTDSQTNGYGIFPDFDFVFTSTNSLFDGLTLKKHAVKTIDGRYTSKREYSSTKQAYISYFELAISPAYFSHFYEKLTEKYSKYGINSIAVSTLGSYLNSDFDEDEPYNREDAKKFTTEAFAYISERYSDVLTKGGNAYTWGYVDYITDIALDSSRYNVASASVPFLGLVLHGYVEIAGSPINMEGNMDYALLKAIENGAAIKFILSYQNTENLKEDIILNKYYSIGYSIWESELVETYNELNALLKGVQTSKIVHHEFINNAYRIPDNAELKNDAEAAIKAAIELEKKLAEEAEMARREALKLARKQILTIGETVKNATDSSMANAPAYYINVLNTIQYPDYLAALDQLKAAKASGDAAKIEEAEKLAIEKFESICNTVTSIINSATNNIAAYEKAVAGYELIMDENAYTENIRTQLKATLDEAKQYYDILLGYDDIAMEAAKKAYDDLKAVDSEIEIDEFEMPEKAPVEIPGDEEDEEEEEIVTSKYDSDKNKIVYEIYENGTAFLLNFNNYAVSVTLPANGITYTIEAYGYIVVSMAA